MNNIKQPANKQIISILKKPIENDPNINKIYPSISIRNPFLISIVKSKIKNNIIRRKN